MKKRKWSSEGYTLLSAVLILFVVSLMLVTMASTVQVRYLNAVKESKSFYGSIVLEAEVEAEGETH